jgi:hypothetical protein
VIIKEIDADPILYKNVVDLWKRDKEKESIIKTIKSNNALHEKIKGIVLEKMIYCLFAHQI